MLHLFLLLLVVLLLSLPGSGLVVVLGGNGYVGSTITQKLNDAGIKTVTVGRSSTNKSPSPLSTHVTFDLVSATPTLSSLLSSTPHSPSEVTAVVHSIGCLLDTSSGLGSFNKFASGTGREPGGSYDEITRGTVSKMVGMLEGSGWAPGSEPKIVFVSAAEAGWDAGNGGETVERLLAPGWLKRYLKAKREAEGIIRGSGRDHFILRPSIIYSEGDVGSLGARVGFTLGERAGIKFVEGPIEVGTLAKGVRLLIEGKWEGGIWNGRRIKELNGTGQTPLHMALGYDYHSVADFLLAHGADDSIKNNSGHPAKFGIDGDKDPSDPMYLLDSCKNTKQALAALKALSARANEAPEKLDKGVVAMMGMQVKKGNKNLEKGEWTDECQAKFKEVMEML
ncbi:hypothetical protein TrRE_jg13306 [Triparma retinervis]|uniref:NAD-dependent epimerase/dehydratase domain-containing protein n=1 Tax=Triparma retinervis TaxID=2557542 RepID=A0A9W7A4Z9_9STRA|nr:hypothetical protein TrRE_jg13306 [Triparma retinervis]